MKPAPEKPTKGMFYKVTGRRGNAKAAYGTEGRCIYVAESTDFRGRFTGYRVGLKPESGEPVWVAATQVTQIEAPAAFAAAEIERLAVRAAQQAQAARFPAFVGPAHRTAGSIGLVFTGKDAGKQGRVFWRGEDKKNPGTYRLGLKTDDGETVWCSEREAVAPVTNYGRPATEDERAVMFAQAEAMMFALDGIGRPVEAAQWSNRAITLSVPFATAVAS